MINLNVPAPNFLNDAVNFVSQAGQTAFSELDSAAQELGGNIKNLANSLSSVDVEAVISQITNDFNISLGDVDVASLVEGFQSLTPDDIARFLGGDLTVEEAMLAGGVMAGGAGALVGAVIGGCIGWAAGGPGGAAAGVLIGAAIGAGAGAAVGAGVGYALTAGEGVIEDVFDCLGDIGEGLVGLGTDFAEAFKEFAGPYAEAGLAIAEDLYEGMEEVAVIAGDVAGDIADTEVTVSISGGIDIDSEVDLRGALDDVQDVVVCTGADIKAEIDNLDLPDIEIPDIPFPGSGTGTGPIESVITDGLNTAGNVGESVVAIGSGGVEIVGGLAEEAYEDVSNLFDQAANSDYGVVISDGISEIGEDLETIWSDESPVESTPEPMPYG